MILILKDKKTSNSGTEKTIASLAKKLGEKNATPFVASFEEMEIFIRPDKVEVFFAEKNMTQFSTIFFRRVGEFKNRAYIVTLLAKKHGIKFMDEIYAATNEPGKLKQTTVLALEGISVPKTYFAGEYNEINLMKAIDFLKFPIVAKVSKNKQGEGVFLAHTIEELACITKEKEQAEVILQEFIPNEFDYRILVLGENVACVEKRTRTDKNEFRNNVALGASEEFVDENTVAPSLLGVARAAARAANIQVAGVDIVVAPGGKEYVFEVNRSPAFTHDDTVSQELNHVVDYLIECEKKN